MRHPKLTWKAGSSIVYKDLICFFCSWGSHWGKEHPETPLAAFPNSRNPTSRASECQSSCCVYPLIMFREGAANCPYLRSSMTKGQPSPKFISPKKFHLPKEDKSSGWKFFISSQMNCSMSNTAYFLREYRHRILELVTKVGNTCTFPHGQIKRIKS